MPKRREQEELAAAVDSLREESAALRKKFGELEQRLHRLEIREEILESPGAPGDAPVKYE